MENVLFWYYKAKLVRIVQDITWPKLTRLKVKVTKVKVSKKLVYVVLQWKHTVDIVELEPTYDLGE